MKIGARGPLRVAQADAALRTVEGESKTAFADQIGAGRIGIAGPVLVLQPKTGQDRQDSQCRE